MGSNVGKLT